jgi:hypothetical protein
MHQSASLQSKVNGIAPSDYGKHFNYRAGCMGQRFWQVGKLIQMQ